MKVELKSLDGDSLGKVDLKSEVFGLEPRVDIIKRVVDWQLLARMSGTHKAKVISEISGTTKKPFKQKGTGNARQGSMRSVQMRGGAVSHGPVPRSHGVSLNKKLRKAALKYAVSARAKEKGALTVLDNLDLKSHKTKDLSLKLKKLTNSGALILCADDSKVDNFSLALRNIPGYKLLPASSLNVYDIVKHSHLFIEKDALSAVEEKLL